MYSTYILYSKSINKFYIGHTQDLEKRLKEHCSSKNLGANDWVIKYSKSFQTRSDAMKHESEIKKKKSRVYIERLIC